MGHLCTATVAALFAMAAIMPTSAQETPPSSLPGGASALQETFADWQVVCAAVETGRSCAMSQVQAQQNGQRVLAIELQPGKDGGATGVLILPFGLALEAGATLTIDSNPPLASLRFATCLPAGCLMPLSFSAADIAALEAATTMTANASSMDAGQPVSLAVSLKGFTAAYARLGQLANG